MILDAVITGMLLAGSVAYLGWYFWSRRQQASRCAGCVARLRSR